MSHKQPTILRSSVPSLQGEETALRNILGVLDPVIEAFRVRGVTRVSTELTDLEDHCGRFQECCVTSWVELHSCLSGSLSNVSLRDERINVP
jgi:hypothetical protein